MQRLSIILPARDEATGLSIVLPELRARFPNAELIVVNDGSTDDTAAIALSLGAKVIGHAYSMGNGATVKTGARAASGDVLVFMDADGQHNPADVTQLLAALSDNIDMVVGARIPSTQANIGRRIANGVYNRLASWIVNHRIADLTSGFRAVRADKFREFLFLLPNGFSYPTTITISFFRAAYTVAYVPIHARTRSGVSHINPLRDGARFLLIIFKIGTLYSPLKLFAPVSLAFFLTAAVYYGYTYFTTGRLTNMSTLLFSASVVIFLIGLVSEQITMLLYKNSHGE